MDEPKRDISWLESFPPDIWAYFVSYLPGEQLLRLLMTGATFLRQRLKSPTVVKSIELGSDFIVFKSLPLLLHDFPSLEELSIHCCDIDWSTKLGLKLAAIPSGVRKLELSGYWGHPPLPHERAPYITFDLFAEPSRTALKLSEHLPCLNTLCIHDYDHPYHSWMLSAPPTLTRLVLKRWDGSELPSSLIHFRASKAVVKNASSIPKLPPSLQSFVILDIDGIDWVLPLLPPSIQTLNLGHRVQSSQSILEQLPKSLTCFTVPKSPHINFKTNPELISLLPSTLTELEVKPRLPCAAWPLLPPRLTKLELSPHRKKMSAVVSKLIDERGVEHKVPSYPFDLLPRTITRLKLVTPYYLQFFCGPPAAFNGSYFPPHLSDLEIVGIQLSPETAKLLPRSLTRLRIANLCERVCQHLPTGLTSLESVGFMMSPNLFSSLPKSLITLDLSIFTTRKFSTIPNYGEWFDKNGDKKSVSASEEYSVHKICTSDNYTGSECTPQSHQLPNLLELGLFSENLSDLSIPLLPRHLTTLRLSKSKKISGKSFEFLPRYLISLDLNSSESIFDSEIRLLPRTLKHVYLGRAVHLTDLCIRDLPPHLEKLDCYQNAQITPSCYPHLPYPIRAHRKTSANFKKWQVGHGRVYLYTAKK